MSLKVEKLKTEILSGNIQVRRNGKSVKTIALNSNNKILPFAELPTTTITLVIHLFGKINPTPAFYLLPITKIDIPEESVNNNKFRAPHHISGSLLSLRYKGKTRGLVCRQSTKHFKHSITVDISVTSKNVNLKISPNTIQLCGASSVVDGEEAANFIVEYLLNIQRILDRIREDKNKDKIFRWAEDITKGPPCDKIIPYELPEVTLLWMEPEADNDIIQPLGEYPDFVDQEIGDFLFQGLWEFRTHSSYCGKLEFIKNCLRSGVIYREENISIVLPKCKSLDDFQEEELSRLFDSPESTSFQSESTSFQSESTSFQSSDSENSPIRVVNVDEYDTEELGILDVEEVMVNYNFNLGFYISRQKAAELLKCEYFNTRFDNALSETLFVEMPCLFLPDRRKRGRIPKISFIVYKTGSVTLSGPGGRVMHEGYNKFMEKIVVLRKEIEMKEDFSL